jgi:hypothetical protein
VGKPHSSRQNIFWREARPGEVKHLSTRRKRNQKVIPLVAASERGGAQTRGYFLWGCGAKTEEKILRELKILSLAE